MGGELKFWGIQPLILPPFPDSGTYDLWNTFFRTNLTPFLPSSWAPSVPPFLLPPSLPTSPLFSPLPYLNEECPPSLFRY